MNERALAKDPERLSAALFRSYPQARCELLVRDPWELLVAAILSARTNEGQVNRVMAVLCEHYCGPEAYASLDHRDLARVISKVPLYQQKARAIVEAARAVLSRHGGNVPDTMKELAALPGVGRKTAAIVLGNAFGIPAIAADIHVQRIVRRLGWSERENALEAEQAIAQRYPPHHWVQLCHQLIRLGREHCRPMAPKCSTCPFTAECPRKGVAESR
jgi:endonuclease III